MKVKSLGKNVTEIVTNRHKILVSYETPVAMICIDDNCHHDKAAKTEKSWSVTTSRHINQWFVDNGFDPELAITLTQDFFDLLLN